MNPVQIKTVDEIGEDKVNQFLGRVYRKRKSEFLRDHGAWLHRGNGNRFVAVRGGEIVAYCATTPTRCLLKGKERNAVWGIDMIVAPEYRGQRLQAVMDNKLQELPHLKVAFPNELHAKIVQKHGWGVRDDLRYMLLPLVPARVRHVLLARGLKGFSLKCAAAVSSPIASIVRRRFARYRPKTARQQNDVDPSVLAQVFMRHNYDEKLMMTCRDEEFFRWRYLTSPYRSELSFYLAGPDDAPSHVLIARTMESTGIRVTRILDIFGDFQDRDGLRDIIRLALRDSVHAGSCQVTVLDSVPGLVPEWRSLGFLFSLKMRFCWFSTSDAEMSAIRSARCYWTLGDSDNDAPE